MKAATAAASRTSIKAKSLASLAHSTVSFLNNCPACSSGAVKVIVYYSPLAGPGRLSSLNNGLVSQGFFSIPTGTTRQLIATSQASAAFFAYCDTSSRPLVAGSASGAFNLLDSSSATCIRVPVKTLKLPQPGATPVDLIVNLKCGSQSTSSGEQQLSVWHARLQA